MKERVTVLQFLGQKVESAIQLFNVLFETACTLKTGGQIPNIISAPSNNKLPVVCRPNLYVREAYKDLYTYITVTFKDIPTEDIQNLLIITGTSGIGKSAFLIYLTIRLLIESNNEGPPIIIFHTKEGSKCYAFGGTSTLRVGSITDFEHFLELPETWYLVDSSPEPVLNTAKTLIAASSKTYYSEDKQYQEVSKESPLIYYMAPWDWDELENCRQIVFSVVPQDLMERLYTKMGGVPRYVLQASAKVLARDPNDTTTAEDQAFVRVRRAIDEVKDAAKLLEYIGQAKDSLELSSRLLHRWPNENDRRCFHLKWASVYIQVEIERKLNDQTWVELLKDLVRKDQYIARGPLFELYVLHIFRKGGYKFEIKKLEGDLSLSDQEILKDLPIQTFTKTAELFTPTDMTLFIPTISNFPCLDLFVSPNDLFQVTVSLDHPVKQNKLKEIVDSILKGTNRQLKLCFIVPDDIYDNFRKQNYTTEIGTVSQRIPILVKNNVTQYALKFDITAASNGQSPGLEGDSPY